MAKEIKLIPPSDPRVQSAIAPFSDDMLKDEGFKDRKELSDSMFDTMKKYGGIGLTCNQVGLPFNMFVLGDHVGLENGLKMACFNPIIISSSVEEETMKEGCLTFPFLFLNIERPRQVEVEFLDEKLDKKTYQMDGIIARCFLHEMDHMNGVVFTDIVSKLKYDMAMKKRDKYIKKLAARVKDKIKDDKETGTTNT